MCHRARMARGMVHPAVPSTFTFGDFQIDLDAFGNVVGIEEDVDAGCLADCLVDRFRVFGHAQQEGLVVHRLELSW